MTNQMHEMREEYEAKLDRYVRLLDARAARIKVRLSFLQLNCNSKIGILVLISHSSFLAASVFPQIAKLCLWGKGIHTIQ